MLTLVCDNTNAELSLWLNGEQVADGNMPFLHLDGPFSIDMSNGGGVTLFGYGKPYQHLKDMLNEVTLSGHSQGGRCRFVRIDLAILKQKKVRELHESRGVWSCHKCGHKLSPDAQSCLSCGRRRERVRQRVGQRA